MPRSMLSAGSRGSPGKRGYRGKARRGKNVVFTQSAASSSSEPGQEELEQPRHAKVNAVNRIKGQHRQVGHPNGLYDWEEKQEESLPQVNHHSWTPQPPTVSLLPLKMSFPMCGNRLSAGRTMELNPWAP